MSELLRRAPLKISGGQEHAAIERKRGDPENLQGKKQLDAGEQASRRPRSLHLKVIGQYCQVDEHPGQVEPNSLWL